MNENCNVLVLGGNGFLGTNICAYLNRAGYTVTSFDINPPAEPIKGVCYLQGDFFREETLVSMMEGQDAVIHALSTISPTNSNRDYMRGYEKDFLQTVRLLNMLAARSKRLLYLSSAGTVYGNYTGTPFTEGTKREPINHYGAIKVCIENVMHAFNKQQHASFISCRISNPYGYGQDYRKGVGFINAVIHAISEKRPLEVWGDGSVIRDYIYITDVCQMLEFLLRYDGDEEVFNLSTGIGTSQNDIIEAFRSLGFTVDVRYLEARTVDALVNIVDNRRIFEASGIMCTPIEEGIMRYLRHLCML